MSVNDSHNKAMDFAERAFVERIQGRREQAHSFFVQALEYELEAIAQLEVEGRVEPTYSVLHRSAATLALDCNQTQKAKEIATQALSQNPHPEIADELHELLLRISLPLSPQSLRNDWNDEDMKRSWERGIFALETDSAPEELKLISRKVA